MGNTEKNNRLGDIGIILKLDKICFYPGENMKGKIRLILKNGLFEECKKFSRLNIMIVQCSNYEYIIDNGYDTDGETIILMAQSFHFNDFIGLDNVNEINLPFNCILPKTARPTIIIKNTDYVKHIIIIEYPHFKIKRSYLFVVKNNLKFHSKGTKLLTSCFFQTTFEKSKIFQNKSPCKLIINMPKNFFLYNEKVEYKIQLDCRNLDIPVNKVVVTFYRIIKMNYSKNILKARKSWIDNLYINEYSLPKEKKLFTVDDHFLFPNTLNKKNDFCIPPSIVYQFMEQHGLYDVNDKNILRLLPGCSEGLINIYYFLKVKIHFDSILTSNEFIDIPLEFCDIIDNKISNQNNKNINNNMNNIKVNNNDINNAVDTSKPTPSSNNSQENLNIDDINISSINDDNDSIILDKSSAPLPFDNKNIEGKKDPLDDKENINTGGWVIIDENKLSVQDKK